MPDPADVRPATQADAGALAELEREANLPALAHVFPADEHPFPRAEVEERWRRGWGRALAERAVSHMGPQPRLWCLVDNAGARELYEQLGWRPTGREQPAEWPPHPGGDRVRPERTRRPPDRVSGVRATHREGRA